jgi:hypothetical protein
MMSKRVLLWDITHIMLIIEDSDGVRYQNQAGGVVCAQPEMEGVLCPLGIDAVSQKRIQLLPYTGGIQGISVQIADEIDAVLASRPATRFLKVDRTKLEESWEAWVHVVVDSPEDSGEPERDGGGADAARRPGDRAPPATGFGTRAGVLTWDNSD